ncbi:MAG: PGF-pre-PGF domain-containing protein [Candidatus Methanomethylicus sp.]|nr:PGF-pre-PGF domain-containing protein [Candidatus Methanomethylicus sp.]
MASKKIGMLLIALFLFSTFAFTTTTTVKSAGPYKILLITSEFPGEVTNVTNDLLGFSDFSTVDSWNYNTNTTLPTIDELFDYDALLVWTNIDGNYSLVGDLISDYLDAGGKAVIMTFSDSASWNLGGRYLSTNKNLLAPTDEGYDYWALGTIENASHPVMANVTTFGSNYRANTNETVNGGIVIARYESAVNYVLAAQSPIYNMITLNFYPPERGTSDGPLMERNALVFVIEDLHYTPYVPPTTEFRVLLMCDDESWASTVQTALSAYTDFDEVVLWNYYSNTTWPTLEELSTYNAVCVWTNYNPPDTMGDLISDYLDNGGGVVVMTFADSAGWAMGGRYISTGKNLLAPTDDRFGTLTLGELTIPSHPVLAGVTTFSAYYHNNEYDTINGGIVIAKYNNGVILAAESPTYKMITLNFFPSDSTTGDASLLIRNALLYVYGAVPYNPGGPKNPDQSRGMAFDYTITQGFTFANFVNLMDTRSNAFAPSSIAITNLDVTCTRSFQHVQLLIDETNDNPIYPIPVALPSGLTVYKYEKLVIGVPPSTIAEVTFTFKVPQSWFSSFGVAKTALNLYQFNGGSWDTLPTTMLSEDSSFVYYTASSTGQGVYAIAG